MSILVTLYYNVSHAYTVSNFSMQNPVLSKVPSFCANSHLPGYGRLSGKDTKSFEWLHSLPIKRKSRRQWLHLARYIYWNWSNL